MRRPIIVGNWKMNLDRAAAVSLARELVEAASALPHVDLAVCPPYVYLEAVGKEVSGSQVGLGAQNVSHEPNGAFTGEVSTAMLNDLGCDFVILGHSERRQFMGETDELINKKLHAAFAAGLEPILCVGELLAEREAGKTVEVVRSQFTGSCAGLSDQQMAKLVVAYEPVWAIGTGKVATPEQAEEVHLALRKIIAEQYNQAVADRVRIQYGGSVKPSNAVALMSQPNIDGALVGGASLISADFIGIVAGLPKE